MVHGGSGQQLNVKEVKGSYGLFRSAELFNSLPCYADRYHFFKFFFFFKSPLK